MASSRRSSVSSGRPPSRKSDVVKPQAQSALEPNSIPEIDPDEPEEPAAAEAEAAPGADGASADEAGSPPAESSSGSSRRMVRQSSRRLQAQSSSGVPGYKKSARILTPAEIAARKKAARNGLYLAIVILVAFGGAWAAWQFLLRENPLEKRAFAQLSEGTEMLKLTEDAINNRQSKDARSAYAKGIKALQVPELGNAKEPIDPKDPNLASMALAMKAVEVNKQLHATEPRIDQVERDAKVDANSRAILDSLGKLADLDKVALLALEKRIPLFVANPVEPDAGSPNDYQGAYKDITTNIKNQMTQVDQENARRLASITSDQEKKAHSEIEVLVKQELFNEALVKLDDYKGKFEQGNFDSLRDFVKTSAEQSWTQAKTYAESRYTDYKSPGIPEPLAKQALSDARARLEQVIAKFGIDDYVNQAKELLAKYPAQP
jgi:hypothetical protein